MQWRAICVAFKTSSLPEIREKQEISKHANPIIASNGTVMSTEAVNTRISIKLVRALPATTSNAKVQQLLH